jgi:hypothetical protein
VTGDFKSNIVTGCSYGIHVVQDTGASGIDIDFNAVFDNDTHNYKSDPGDVVARGGSGITEDPQLVDPDNGDFRLYDTSPCIGSGEGGVNMGAYQGEGIPSPRYLPIQEYYQDISNFMFGI